jgi:predicted  nucleic acid-binding Zn-ribbon protein
MGRTSLTVEILKQIRDEVRKTNERLDATNERLDATNARLEAMNDDLGRRIVESELRTATAITDLAGTVRELIGYLRAQADLRPRVEKCERDIADLQRGSSR